MSIVTKGYGGYAIASWGYGDLIVKVIRAVHPFAGITTIFKKLDGLLVLFNISNNTGAEFERIIAETSEDLVADPPGGDLQVIPTVSVSFDSNDRVKVFYESIDLIDAFMDRVISEEPIVQVKDPETGDLQIIPTVGINYRKSNEIRIKHGISDKVNTTFIRIIAEEI
jgi:hypothetical protein